LFQRKKKFTPGHRRGGDDNEQSSFRRKDDRPKARITRRREKSPLTELKAEDVSPAAQRERHGGVSVFGLQLILEERGRGGWGEGQYQKRRRDAFLITKGGLSG